MERQEIEVFLMLAGELHFGRTAERLRLSQARVSQTIKGLERRIGAPLFDRTSRRVALTPIGRQLRDDLAPAHEQMVAAYARVTAAARGVTGRLRVVFMGPVAGALVVEVADAFRAEHPGCAVDVQETRIDDPCRPVREDDADLAITQLPVREPGLVGGPVAIREERVLAVSRDHPLAGRASVSLEDLARDRVFGPAGQPSEDWQQSHLPWHTPSGRPIQRGEVAGTFQELLTKIAAGAGFCPVAAHNRLYYAQPGIAYVPFTDAPPFAFGPVWREATETAAVRDFVRALGAVVAARGGPDEVGAAAGRAASKEVTGR